MKKIVSLAFFVFVILGFSVRVQGKGIEPVKKDSLGVHNGNTVFLYTLKNSDGNILKLTNYGARIVRVEVPDKNGVKDNITVGAETLDGILRGDQFGGSIVGRYANRIANGKFTLDGVVYNLQANNPPNTLHGGKNGWFSKEWNG